MRQELFALVWLILKMRYAVRATNMHELMIPYVYHECRTTTITIPCLYQNGTQKYIYSTMTY